MKLTVGLLNDSFPPTTDGVSTTIFNYAKIIHRDLGKSIVITPKVPGAPEDNYPFEVFRYKSFPFSKKDDYRMGYPLLKKDIDEMASRNFDILHVHCPLASGVFARMIKRRHKIPIVVTYHTKFDYDIKVRMPGKFMQEVARRFIISNINSADEVWTVSKGVGENLRNLGYEGDYRIMRNGVDFPKGKTSAEKIASFKSRYGIAEDEIVFLYVGRMMWYKNIKLSLNALKNLKDENIRFRMFFVGKGNDLEEIKTYVNEIGLDDRIVFAGKITDREELRTFYSSSDMLLFPSTYDTNGLVVTEAAACGCASLLIRGSCASENIEDGISGFLAEENAEDITRVIRSAISNRDNLRLIGEHALNTIYFSWDDAVHAAYKRYEEIVRAWPYPTPNKKIK